MTTMKLIHDTADISNSASIGKGTYVWNNSQVREFAIIGEACIISKNVYVDHNVKIGNKVKIQNNCSLYFGVEIEDGVFIGPHTVFTNDKLPRAINHDGSVKKPGDWEASKTLVKHGASIGANSTILCGITLGCFCLIGSGSVVTKSVPDFSLFLGNPAKFVAWVCKCGKKLTNKTCDVCGMKLKDIKNDSSQ